MLRQPIMARHLHALRSAKLYAPTGAATARCQQSQSSSLHAMRANLHLPRKALVLPAPKAR